jgi:hypothetical protein
MKEIQLTQGKVALVDDEDFERVSQFKWYASHKPRYANGGSFWAQRGIRVGSKKTTISLHAFLVGKRKGQLIDHIDGNPLNCTKANLRHTTFAQNTSKRLVARKKNNTSGFCGVYFCSKSRKWRARIKSGNKNLHLGRYADKLEAAKAYNEAAIKYHGEFATLNPIEGDE